MISVSFALQFSVIRHALSSRDAQNFCGSEIHFESAHKVRPHECGNRCIQEFKVDLWKEYDRDKDR